MAEHGRVSVLMSPRCLELNEVPVPTPAPDEMLLRIDACGVCGSDVALYLGETATPLPVVPGHEIVGTIVAMGETAQTQRGLSIGDRLALEEAIPCHACPQCLEGRHRICGRARRYGSTLFEDGGQLLGGLADFALVPGAAIAHRVPVTVDPVVATLFIPLSNGLSWVNDAGAVRPGQAVLVQGPGQHGLACAYAARRAGAARVIVSGTDRDSLRLETALRLGADLVVNVGTDDLVEVVLRATDGRGADVVVDATPNAVDPVTDSVRCAAIGGRVVLAGLKRGRLASVDVDAIVRRELRLIGVAARQSWAIPAALTLLATDQDLVDSLRGPVFPLACASEAIKSLMSQRPVHSTVVPPTTAVEPDG